ncbi:MAG: FHA domain-containing protein [Clostridia bacterium]|nr:FHA domain-containing protein [Clostridia bacterium]
MVKRKTFVKQSLALVLVFLFAALSCVGAFGAVAGPETEKIVRVSAALPEINVEVSSAVKADDISAYIGGDQEALERLSSQKVDETTSLTCFVIDNSTSMVDSSDGTPAGAFESIKAETASLIYDKANSNHAFCAYSFGKNNLNDLGIADSADAASELGSKIKALGADEEGTSLNDALLDVFDALIEKRTEYNAIRVVLVTDQAGDFSTGSSGSSVNDVYQYHELPLYAIVLSEASNSDNIKDINTTCAKSGGYAGIVSAAEESDKLSDLYNTAQNNTIITFETSYTRSSGIQRLTVKDSKGSKIDAIDFRLDNIKNESGEVTAVIRTFDRNQITVRYDRPVEGANLQGNYSVQRGNKEITPNSVTESKKNREYILRFDNDLYSGDYSISFVNITDANGNAVTPIAQKLDGLKSPLLKLLPIVIIVVAVGLVLLAFYLILLNLKKKKNVTRIKEIFETQVQETVEERHHVQNVQAPPAGVPVRLTMQTGNYPPNKISLKVDRSFIFGRSSVCEVFTDDRKLSRQHFAVENINGIFMIQDLNTTNGTYLNGIRVVGRQKLKSGDVIRAGLTTIKIEF